ncbi:hypothetical protein Ao3042_09218 [Aspergillus oryzae 3.042]|uniref:Uncharacterized protein n=1 Tax=Aspergillus oryzae (strain 3.042) TaxID=1160506 RepID=I8IC76_ASPO3|nr:hypothetical protein Ao3042_09218 [Aspergillus oryzae 3.042]|eukprot:EIT75286.1 hypothetical protein Ao3042_09218 [Aspergillus oryzae 3.042]
MGRSWVEFSGGSTGVEGCHETGRGRPGSRPLKDESSSTKGRFFSRTQCFSVRRASSDEGPVTGEIGDICSESLSMDCRKKLGHGGAPPLSSSDARQNDIKSEGKEENKIKVSS